MKTCSSLCAVVALTAVVLVVGSSVQTRAVGAATAPPATRPSGHLVEVLGDFQLTAEQQAPVLKLVAQAAAQRREWALAHKDEFKQLYEQAKKAGEGDAAGRDALYKKWCALAEAIPAKAKDTLDEVHKHVPTAGADAELLEELRQVVFQELHAAGLEAWRKEAEPSADQCVGCHIPGNLFKGRHPASAQTRPAGAATAPAATRPGRSLAEVLKSLPLSAEQQAQIQQIVAKVAADQKAWVAEHKVELMRLRDEAGEAAEDKDQKAFRATWTKVRAMMEEIPSSKDAEAQIAKHLPEPLAGALVASTKAWPVLATQPATPPATQRATQRDQTQAQVRALRVAVWRRLSIHPSGRDAMFSEPAVRCDDCHLQNQHP